MRDCERIENNIKRKYYTAWAYAYFLAVRLEGWKHFTYRQERLSLEQLLLQCEKKENTIKGLYERIRT